jgi:AcrR family transcriptional regulator
MRPKASDANDGGAAEPERSAAEVRERIMKAMLSAAGEVGYGNVSVQKVLDRAGSHRTQFYRHFDSATTCFQDAYAAEADRLCDALLAAGRQGPGWRGGLTAALEELASFAREQPDLARGLLIEVHAAGEPARVKRKEVFERLSRAIDRARRETESRHSPPPLTAVFIVHVIDAAMVDVISQGAPERFAPEELTELVAIYFEDER